LKRAFVDTNALVCHFTGKPEDQVSRVDDLLHKVDTLEIQLVLTDTVIFETVHVLTHKLGVDRASVCAALKALLAPLGVNLSTKSEVIETLDLWMRESPLTFADCFHLVMTKSLGLSEIYSFDKQMNRYPGVARIKP
jgi:predicted nucleic acid-binding protein